PVLLVTGGSRGIGASVCRLAGLAGWQVAVNYVSNLGAAEAVVADIRNAGGSAISVEGDVGTELGLASIFSTIDGTFGRLDGLVN
ncbi:SDR family NAD(P)-dependent oxidoreductase, partial [Acinetobacter baumannii]|uniref:SDR family NAD(P)-dependent oxidoreductase n=1 Tax=Acinetobacter baumannii TaxID=470 RepID=UPI00300C1EE5